jgi:hypothetical protein
MEGSHILYISAVQRSYVLAHNSLMPMEVQVPPHYYYYYYYRHHHHLILTTTTTTDNNNKIIRNLILTKSFVNIIIFTYNLA